MEFLFLDKKILYSNLTKRERYDTSIIVKEADKVSGVVGRSKKNQLDDKEVYQELRGDVESPLDKIVKKVIRKLRSRGDVKS